MRLPVTPRTTLLRAVRDEMRDAHPGGRIIIAVDGPSAADTASLADDLADVVAERGSSVLRASTGGFLLPRSQRIPSGGEDPMITAFDASTCRRVLLEPFLQEGQRDTGVQLAVWDALRDQPRPAKWVTAPSDAVLIIDGPGLHRGVLGDLWDWRVLVRDADEPQSDSHVAPALRPAQAVLSIDRAYPEQLRREIR